MEMTTAKRIFCLAVAITMLATAFTYSSAYAGGGRGVVCNFTDETVWVTVEDVHNVAWHVTALSPGVCTYPLNEDAEAIWGKQCNTNGDCWLQTWKVGDGVFSLTSSFVSPIPPGKVFQINGWGHNSGWSRDSNWPSPDPASIQYEISR
jgi:hypothetical protein